MVLLVDSHSLQDPHTYLYHHQAAPKKVAVAKGLMVTTTKAFAGRTGAEGVIIRWIYCPLLHLDRRTGKNQELVQCTRASRPIPEVLVPIFSVEPSETAPPAVRWAAWVTAEAAVPRSVLPFKSRRTSLGMRFILFLSSRSNAWQDWKRKRKG